MDEEILSDEFEDDDEVEIASDSEAGPAKKAKLQAEEASASDDDFETPQEKKIRLAKQYLSALENRERDREGRADGEEGEEEDPDVAVHRSNMISAHLKDSVLEKAGKLHRQVADRYSLGPWADVVTLKNGHRKTITACVVSTDGKHVFTASQDCSIIKWDRATGKRITSIFGNHKHKNPEQFKGHAGTINALAISTDGKFLASGDVNKLIHIWNPKDMTHVHTFRGHRGAVTGLVFRRSFHQLFSCSEDRMVKVWNLDEMAYVESLFGHHDTISAIDSFVRERAITAGSRDGTIRLWKIPEESNLIFLEGANATIDCVKFIDETHFISGYDDGTVSLWALFKKKPLAKVLSAHDSGKWITAIASLRNTDLFATASHNGKIYFWKIGNEFRNVTKIFEYDVVGFVNSLEFTSDGKYLIAAVSQEHRLGRWWRIKEAKNCVHVIPLNSDVELDF